MARKFTLTSRTVAGQIDFVADLNEEQLAVTRAKDELYLVSSQLYRNRSRSLIMMKPAVF